MSAPRRVLITGGVRSGKSTYAERLLWEAPATYLATGPTRPDDDEWRARVAAHQQRRPSHWSSLESVDVPRALNEIHGPCLLDDVGSWLTSALEESGAWVSDTGEGPRRGDEEPSTPPPMPMPTPTPPATSFTLNSPLPASTCSTTTATSPPAANSPPPI